MDRTRAIFIGIIVVTLVIVGGGLLLNAFNQILQGDGTSTPPGTPLPKDAVVVEIHSSNTKEDWMDQVVASFHEQGYTIGDKPIVVTVYHVGSGSSMSDILEGEIEPVVWSPGSDLWVTAINQSWRDRTGRPLTDESCPATLPRRSRTGSA